MQQFAALVKELSNTTRTNDKRDALVRYLRGADDQSRLWVIALLTGRRPRRLVNSTLMKEWCMEVAGLRRWLFDEGYHTVGDLSEAIALMLPEPQEEAGEELTLPQLMDKLKALTTANDEEKYRFITTEWKRLHPDECLVFNKLIIGGFRMGVSEALMINALAIYLERGPQEVAHIISGNWEPYSTDFQTLLESSASQGDSSKPYPFYLAYPVDSGPQALGEPADWQAEWKWDGIRGQLIRRQGQLYLWSRGEDLITERFPEIQALLPLLPDGLVLDGEILSYRDGLPLSFQGLQTRIARKKVSKKQLEEAPVVFMAYDVLEHGGQDVRQMPMSERRALLESLGNTIHNPALILSPVVSFASWQELSERMAESRDRATEGFMIKRKSSIYQAGRRRGDWWKWKVEPLSVDAVMIYAQKGTGKRSNLYTDYTFAVRDGHGGLVPFAKAYSGLTDKEIAEVDRFVKANSIEQFGPVRTVKATRVFEIGFEGITASSRHKSGVAVRFPRILRQRPDKTPEEINTLDDLKGMLEQFGAG